ncbi:response regulator transcription factor [Flavobacterium sp. WC2430]|uniref:response regulator transcription factor n=1 Tax=Flavobacterium sp. WC2430 TaxID=3234137 RepID=UPI0034663FB4
MENNTSLFYDNVKKVWNEIAKKSDIKNVTFQVELYKKLIDFFQVGNYYYFIFNVQKAKFEYMNENIFTTLGYNSDILVADFLKKIHPEDQSYFLNFEKELNIFFKTLELDKISKYKVQYDFRIKNANNIYKRILHQLMIIQHDDEKNLLLSFGVHTDITHVKDNGVPKLSFIGFEGEPSYHNVKVDSVLYPTKEILSKREKEILGLIIQGYKSFAIADTLCISKHTVDSHRKNILKKTNCHNVSELISKSFQNSWI